MFLHISKAILELNQVYKSQMKMERKLKNVYCLNVATKKKNRNKTRRTVMMLMMANFEVFEVSFILYIIHLFIYINVFLVRITVHVKPGHLTVYIRRRVLPNAVMFILNAQF